MNREILNTIGCMLELSKKDIENILQNRRNSIEEVSQALGPIDYTCGGYYGTISINHFNIERK